MALRNAAWVGIFTAAGAMFYALTPIVAEHDAIYRTYAPLVEVDALVRRRYAEPIADRELVEGAIRGMMLQLDPYSGYVAPDELAAFYRRHRGEYVGIGVELGLTGGAVTVIAPIEHSPAMRAGVRPGDTVLAVDDRDTRDLSVCDVDALLDGPAGSTVRVTLGRSAAEKVTFVLTRAPITRDLVTGVRRRSDGSWDYSLDPSRRIAYIRVVHFSEGLSRQFDAALSDIRRNGTQALVLDLRSNPGGLMTEALAVADRFIESGTLLTTVTRRRAVDAYTAAAENADTATPLAVLIDGGSASSSEIVAGALQDHGRAVIIGERSFGKGSVQQFIQLDGGQSGIKLTVAHYRLPSGRTIHKTPDSLARGDWGVVPDIRVKATDGERDAIRRRRGRPDGESLFVDRQLQAAIDALTEVLDDGEPAGGTHIRG